MNSNIKDNMKKIMMIIHVLVLTVSLAGLSACSKPSDKTEKEDSEQTTILENEGELEIEFSEDEETFGE